MKRRNGWYQKKFYPHFDLPLNYSAAKALCEDPSAVSLHSFLPFISFENSTRRFTPKETEKYKNKIRDLAYCSHRDGYIYSYYADLLQNKYEEVLGASPWGACVLGYRSGLGSNLDMAAAAFNEISVRGDCAAIAIDIKDFFPSIDHRVLFENIKNVISQSFLSKDWFAVYRNMTNYSLIKREDLEGLCGVGTRLPKPIADIKTFRRWRRTEPEFIYTNRKPYGIPQGSPISAVFSNVYMIGFDKILFEYTNKIGGSYRRYSDDILILCDEERAEDAWGFAKTEIKKLGKQIDISKDKTEISKFWLDGTNQVCDKPLTYLGLTFDGNSRTLRHKTVSRYYRRMTYAARRTAKIAEELGSKPYRRGLYRSLTHMGKHNFYSYAKRASMATGDDAPKRQLRRHHRILIRKLRSKGK